MRRVIGVAFAAATSLMACGDDWGTQCGLGTQFINGKCLPDTQAFCSAGTRYDKPSQGCVIDSKSCAGGTVLVDGQCQEAAISLADLKERAEPNDELTAPAGEFAAPTLGRKGTTLFGCVTPHRDANQDLVRDSDVDLWVVTAAEPTMLEIRASGIGGLVAGFQVRAHPDDQQLSDEGFVRTAVSIAGTAAERFVILPKAGKYVLAISDARGILRTGAASGSPTSCYYTTLTARAWPAPIHLALDADRRAEPDLQTYGGVPLIFTFHPEDGDALIVDAQPKSNVAIAGWTTMLRKTFNHSVAGVATAANAPAASVRAIAGGLHAHDDIQLIYDPVLTYSQTPHQVAVTKDLYHVAPLAADGGENVHEVPDYTIVDLQRLGHAYFDIAQDGTVAYLEMAANKPIHYAIVDARFRPVATGTVAGRSAILARPSGARTSDAGWFRFANAGRYYLISYSPGALGAYKYAVTLTPTSVAPLTVGWPIENAALGVPARNSAFFTMATNQPWLALTGQASAFNGLMVVRTYDETKQGRLDRDMLATYGATFEADGSSTDRRIFAGGLRGLVRVSSTKLPAPEANFQLRIEGRVHTFVGSSREGAPSSLVEDPIAAGAKKYYFFAAPESSYHVLTLKAGGNASLAVRQLGVDEATAAEFALGQGSGELRTRSPAGWLAVEVHNQGSDGTVTLADAVRTPKAYADICGTHEIKQYPENSRFGLPGDDALSRELSLPFATQLFGQPVTTLRVSSNGWMSMQPGLENLSHYTPMPIPSAEGPQGLISAYWDDLMTMRICYQPHDDHAVIQWQGVLGSAAVATQVTIYKDQSRIDFAYGPGHAAKVMAPIGVESLDGTRGYSLGEVPGPNSRYIIDAE